MTRRAGHSVRPSRESGTSSIPLLFGPFAGGEGSLVFWGKIMSVKVLVADDHEVVRTGLASLFAGSDIKIVAEAANGAEAVKLAIKHKPDVALLDIRMPDSDGLEAL